MQIGAWACSLPLSMSNGDSLNIDTLENPGSNPPIVINPPDPRVDILVVLVGILWAKVTEIIDAHNALVSFADSLFALQTATTRSVWSIFRAILSDVLHLHFVKALHDLTDLVQKIRSWAQKLKGWLDKYKALRRRHDQAVRQLLNLIQRIRRILVPFRILHLKFAQKLDRWLAGVEAKIITHELAIVQKTNEIISWIDLITDPTGKIHGPAVLEGIFSFAGALVDALHAVGVGNVFPARRIRYGQQLPGRPLADWEAPAFKTEASSPSYKEQFDTIVDAFYHRVKEELGT